jgi:hypothetical protein
MPPLTTEVIMYDLRLFTKEEFLHRVNTYDLTDADGHGLYATELSDGGGIIYSPLTACPSVVKKHGWIGDNTKFAFTHILWFPAEYERSA